MTSRDRRIRFWVVSINTVRLVAVTRWPGENKNIYIKEYSKLLIMFVIYINMKNIFKIRGQSTNYHNLHLCDAGRQFRFHNMWMVKKLSSRISPCRCWTSMTSRDRRIRFWWSASTRCVSWQWPGDQVKIKISNKRIFQITNNVCDVYKYKEYVENTWSVNQLSQFTPVWCWSAIQIL